MIKKSILIGLFYTLAYPLFCQNSKDSLLETFVVTAEYYKTTKEKALNKINVIDRKKIEALGAVNLKDVLVNELNIRVGQDNVLGPFMSLQGISGQNVKILIDGVPVIGRLGGNIDLSQINLNNIERIEIVEGPLSVNFGTDALAGTINLISKENINKGISFSLNNYYESVGQYNSDLGLNYKNGNHQLSISGGRYFFDGWSSYDNDFEFPESRPADTLRSKEWNPKEQYFTRFEHYFNKNNFSIKTYFNYFNEKITNNGFPKAPYYEEAFDDYYNTWRNDFGVSFNKTYDLHKLKIIAAYNNFKRIKNTFYKDLTSLNQQLSQTIGAQDTTTFGLLMSRGTLTKSASDFNYQIGYDFSYESGSGRRILNNSSNKLNSNSLNYFPFHNPILNQILDMSIFASTIIEPTNNFTIKPALRITHHNKYNAPIIPSINLKFNKNKFTLRGAYGRGFRAPSLKELYFNFVDINHNIVGNENLKEEKSNNFNFDISWKKIYSDIIFNVECGLFVNSIKNRITLAITNPSTQQYQYVNVGRFQTTGAKINASIDKDNLKFEIGASNIGRYSNFNQSIDVNSFSFFPYIGSSSINKFNFSPEIRSNISYRIPKYGLKISGFFKHNGQLNILEYGADNDVLSESVTSGFNIVDANISKSFKSNMIVFTIGLKNILDVQSVPFSGASGVHSSSSSSVPMSWGRSIFSAVKFNLN